MTTVNVHRVVQSSIVLVPTMMSIAIVHCVRRDGLCPMVHVPNVHKRRDVPAAPITIRIATVRNAG